MIKYQKILKANMRQGEINDSINHNLSTESRPRGDEATYVPFIHRVSDYSNNCGKMNCVAMKADIFRRNLEGPCLKSGFLIQYVYDIHCIVQYCQWVRIIVPSSKFFEKSRTSRIEA